MDTQATQGLLRFFQGISDPRARNARHELGDILAIAILAVLCGAQGWAAVEGWALLNLDFLTGLLELPHGIPTHDTFDRVFALLDPQAFEECFLAWTTALQKYSGDLFVAVDGKTLRRSFRRCWSKTPVHLVSAFVSSNQLVLGQLATESKSNEITAIPKLLALLNLAGTTVTIDAMGCQKEIAAQIIRQQAHYLLAVKDNQPTLYEKVQRLMDEGILEGFKDMPHDYAQQTDKGHGRIQTRQVWVTNQVQWLGAELLGQWPGLASLVVVQRTRQDLGDITGKVTVERGYFISSDGRLDAQRLGQGIRQHWGVENQLHWCLDVSLAEDQSRLRVKHGAENFSRLRRIALNKLKRWDFKKANGKSLHAGIHLKQQLCGWSHKALLEALLA